MRPPERIAVFDNDGTLWVEQPLYTQLVFILDRIHELAPQNSVGRQETSCSMPRLTATCAALPQVWNEAQLKLTGAAQAGNTPGAFEHDRLARHRA